MLRRISLDLCSQLSVSLICLLGLSLAGKTQLVTATDYELLLYCD